MSSLVVLFAAIAAAVAAPQILVQPPNTPAVVLDALGRPLDTAEVASARALHYQAKALEGHFLKKRSIGHSVAYSLPAAVSHQSRVDVHSSPVIEARALYAAPAATVYAAPAATVYAGGSAVSHQSRVDVRTSPSVVASTHVVAAPAVVAEPVVEARAVYAAPAATVYAAPAATVYAGGSAVSHQSRVDVRTSPAVVASTHVVAEPVVEARAVYAAPAASVYSGGAAVTHQSRYDVHSSPAVYAEQVYAPAVVDARSVWAPSVYASTW